jgi:hypothetical protein
MYPEGPLQVFGTRLDSLEMQNRRLKFILLVLSGCICLSLLVGFSQSRTEQNVVVAKDFQLVDNDGRIRARLYFNNRGPMLGFWDSSNKHRITLSLRDEQPSFVLADGSTRERLMAGSNPERTWLKLYDAREKLLWQAPTAIEPAAKPEPIH